MEFKKILFLEIKEENLDQRFWKRVDSISDDKVFLGVDNPEIKNNLASVDCICTKGFVKKIDKEIVDLAPNLRYIGVLATGYGKIDVDYASSKGIVVTNVPGYATNAVAELVFAIILEKLRDLSRARNQAKEGNYSESTFFNTSEIKGKNFGIIGLGRIGSRVAEIALGFGADVYYWSRDRKKTIESKGAKFAELEQLLSVCDFISLHLALSKDTEKTLNDFLIQKIKLGAVVVNLAPNELVDLNALERKLEKGDITYVLDHSDELSQEQTNTLSKYKNCIMYPPIGYTTKEASLAKQEIFVQNMENFLKGFPTNKVK